MSQMPPRNARVVPENGTAQRAARWATRSASQASSEAKGQSVAPPANGNSAGGPNAVNAAILEELQRYREAYGGHPDTTRGGTKPATTTTGIACCHGCPRAYLLGHDETHEEYAEVVLQW